MDDKFFPNSSFQQTCGHCGCIFTVELERPKIYKDIREYYCPECHHHPCKAQTSTPPRITVLSRRIDGRTDRYP